MPLVLDASVALSWLFVDEATAAARALLFQSIEDGIMVPGHWMAEIANGALVGERDRRVVPVTIAHWQASLSEIDTEIDRYGGDNSLTVVLPLARTHGLTIYDALYLELASRRGGRLATFDARLACAARQAGVEVLGA